jgi:hypothetical protein
MTKRVSGLLKVTIAEMSLSTIQIFRDLVSRAYLKDRVSFDVEQGPKGPKASNVTKI